MKGLELTFFASNISLDEKSFSSGNGGSSFIALPENGNQIGFFGRAVDVKFVKQNGCFVLFDKAVKGSNSWNDSVLSVVANSGEKKEQFGLAGLFRAVEGKARKCREKLVAVGSEDPSSDDISGSTIGEIKAGEDVLDEDFSELQKGWTRVTIGFHDTITTEKYKKISDRKKHPLNCAW